MALEYSLFGNLGGRDGQSCDSDVKYQYLQQISMSHLEKETSSKVACGEVVVDQAID
jgi:hypothetical protein